MALSDAKNETVNNNSNSSLRERYTQAHMHPQVFEILFMHLTVCVLVFWCSWWM